jgi:hypothetical protein
MMLRTACSPRLHRAPVDLGSRLLAPQSCGAALDPPAPSTGKQGATGLRLVVCQLPSKSPWLNPIEPKWVHGKRAVSEADRLLSADELEARVYAYYDGERAAHLVMPKKVA